MYSLFHGDPEEEPLYRAVARVTSLLLRMEEAGRRLQETSSPRETPSPLETPSLPPAPAEGESSPPVESSQPPSPPQASPPVDSSQPPSPPGSLVDTAASPQEMEWSFSFEQVLASLLNEPVVVRFFEKPVDIQARLDNAKTAQVKAKANK